MPYEFVARNGIIALNNSIVTGSLTVTQGITGSLFGTASWATNALTSSYILSAVSASFASTASNVLGGAASYIPLWNTATSLSSSVIYQSGGNVGIGTTSPTHKLEVVGDAMTITSDGVYGIGFSPSSGERGGSIQTIQNADRNTAMSFAANGNVGIGTTTPNAKLDVTGNAVVSGSLIVTGTITAQTLVVQTITSSVDFVTGSTRFGSLQSNTHQFTGSVSMTGSLSVVGNGITSSLFGTSSWASNSISASQAQNAVTASYILNAVSASFASTASNVLGGAANYIPLWNTATSLSSSVIYQSSGNVGIGTTSPVSKLVIEADGAANTYAGVIRISNTNANRWGYIGLPDTQTTLTEANNYYLIGRGASTTDRVMSFHIPTTSNYGSGNQPKFGFYSTGVDLLSSIEASTGTVYFKGNVGIGTTTPNAKLDVSGSSIISGSLTVNPGSGNELVVSSTGLSIGNIVSDVHNVTGSLRISGSVITTGSVSATNFTGSLFGTSSWASNAVSSSFALSASWAPVAGTTVFPYTGSALFTGSIILTGSLTTSLNANIGGNASVSGSLVVSGSQYTYGVANTALSATNVITSISTGSYRAAFFNYVMTSGSNARAGQIASVWYINTCSFSETITTDIGSTVGQEMSARISGSFIQLVASSSANWTIDASVNLI